MASNSRLYRNFVILQEDERGYANSDDKTLSGYSKIEAKGDKCKISFYAQNLKKDDDKYYMLLICCKKDTKQIVNLGPLDVSDSGKGEATKEYNVSNIAGLNLEFDKICGTAIAKMNNNTPIFVMCGFLNGQQPSDNWKSYIIVKAKDVRVIKSVSDNHCKRTLFQKLLFRYILHKSMSTDLYFLLIPPAFHFLSIAYHLQSLLPLILKLQLT